jgi:transposase
VSKELGISRNTVKKYIDRVKQAKEGSLEEIIPTHREIKRTCNVLTPEIREKIYQILEENQERPRKQRWTGKKIWRFLVCSGCNIGYSTVKRAIGQWKRDHAHREVYILQEPQPGYRAEFDWGRVDLCIEGQWGKYSMATMVLNNSLYRFSRIYSRETLLEIIAAHIEFFKTINGVPQTIFYDNMRAVIDPSTKTWNPRFLQFAVHYGFEPHACNKQSPHEKGTDEQTVGYIRRTVFSEQNVFSSLNAANHFMIQRLEELNSKPVYRRNHPPDEGLKCERSSLGVLPALEFSNYIIRAAQISKYSLILFESNYYSVPDEYRGKHLTLKIFPERLEMVNGNQIIASHTRFFGKGKYSLDITHYLKTFHRKPGALQHSKAFHQVHDAIQRIYLRHYLNNPKEFLPILSLIRQSSIEGLIYAIQTLEDHQMVPTYDTLRCVLTQQPFQMVEPFSFSYDIRVDEPNLTVYDNFMGGMSDVNTN